MTTCAAFTARPRRNESQGRCLALQARMIYGIGTDICEVRRIGATLARRGDRFAEKVLGPHEIEVFRMRRQKVEARGIAYLATRFSAKEAFSKAIGLGMRMPMTWRACEIVKATNGKPEIRLHGALAEWFAKRSLRAFVTVTDEVEYAASFVVVEYKERVMNEHEDASENAGDE